MSETDKMIEKAREKLYELSMSDEERRIAELREKKVKDELLIEETGYNRGVKEGIEEGIKEGMKEGIESIITKMYENGVDIETISKQTGIDIEEIKKITLKK